MRLIFVIFIASVTISCGSGNSAAPTTPSSPSTLPTYKVTSLFVEDNFTCAILENNQIKCIGLGFEYNGLGSSTIPVVTTNFPLNIDATRSSSSFTSICVVKSNNSLYCYGRNTEGELGRGTNTNYEASTQAPTGLSSSVYKIAIGQYLTCALTMVGATYCWGQNSFGEVGVGNTTNYNTPQLISGITSSDIAPGLGTTCAVTTAGVKCWGYNYHGQIGDGTTTNRTSPTSVSGLPAGPQKIVSAQNTFCALLSGGKVRCWGKGTQGALGNGTASNSSVPVTPTGLDGGVSDIAGFNSGHFCAIVSGEAYCWGNNYYGQLGDGTQIDKSTPFKLTSLGNNVSRVVISPGGHTCALKIDGTVYCWGDSYFGEAGKSCSSGSCNQLTPILINFN